jgi:hypothetical protein
MSIPAIQKKRGRSGGVLLVAFGADENPARTPEPIAKGIIDEMAEDRPNDT